MKQLTTFSLVSYSFQDANRVENVLGIVNQINKDDMHTLLNSNNDDDINYIPDTTNVETNENVQLDDGKCNKLIITLSTGTVDFQLINNMPSTAFHYNFIFFYSEVKLYEKSLA